MQITVTAQDNVGSNQQFASATVIVTVLRDLFSPLFTNLPGSVTLDEQQAVNRTVYTVTATDNDLEVSAIACTKQRPRGQGPSQYKTATSGSRP